MEELNSFQEKFHATDTDILREIEATPDGGALSRDGACAGFYEVMERPGDTYILLDDNDTINACYIHHEHMIEEMNTEKYGWHLERISNQTILTLIIQDKEPPGQTLLNFKFNHRDREGMRQLGLFKQNRSITIYNLAILYGDIIRKGKTVYTVPDKIAEKINP